jgi:hypothetical protein
MDAKTLDALKASIAKWEKNAKVEDPVDYLIDSDLTARFAKLFQQ